MAYVLVMATLRLYMPMTAATLLCALVTARLDVVVYVLCMSTAVTTYKLTLETKMKRPHMFPATIAPTPSLMRRSYFLK